MALKIAINGFGRIGRLALRSIVETGRKGVDIVAINDLGPVETNGHLVQYDSVHGKFPHEVKVRNDTIDVGLGPIKVFADAVGYASQASFSRTFAQQVGQPPGEWLRAEGEDPPAKLQVQIYRD